MTGWLRKVLLRFAKWLEYLCQEPTEEEVKAGPFPESPVVVRAEPPFETTAEAPEPTGTAVTTSVETEAPPPSRVVVVTPVEPQLEKRAIAAYPEPEAVPPGCVRVVYRGKGERILKDFRGWQVKLKESEDLVVTQETYDNLMNPHLPLGGARLWERADG